jgi:hypothetical protein
MPAAVKTRNFNPSPSPKNHNSSVKSGLLGHPDPWRWRHCVLSKRRRALTQRHNVMPQKTRPEPSETTLWEPPTSQHLQNPELGTTSVRSRPDLRFSVFLSLCRLRLLTSQRPRQIPSECLQVHHALLNYIISVANKGSFYNLSGNQSSYVRRTGLGSTGQLCQDGASKYARTTYFRPTRSLQAVPHTWSEPLQSIQHH